MFNSGSNGYLNFIPDAIYNGILYLWHFLCGKV